MLWRKIKSWHRKMDGTRNHYFKQNKPDSDKYHVSLHELVCKYMCLCMLHRLWNQKGDYERRGKHLKREGKGVCLCDWINLFIPERIPCQPGETAPIQSALVKLSLLGLCAWACVTLKQLHHWKMCLTWWLSQNLRLWSSWPNLQSSPQTACFEGGTLWTL